MAYIYIHRLESKRLNGDLINSKWGLNWPEMRIQQNSVNKVQRNIE